METSSVDSVEFLRVFLTPRDPRGHVKGHRVGSCQGSPSRVTPLLLVGRIATLHGVSNGRIPPRKIGSGSGLRLSLPGSHRLPQVADACRQPIVNTTGRKTVTGHWGGVRPSAFGSIGVGSDLRPSVSLSRIEGRPRSAGAKLVRCYSRNTWSRVRVGSRVGSGLCFSSVESRLYAVYRNG
jgi:hypothetical protein